MDHLENRYLLITRYLAKRTSEQENEEVEAWINMSPENTKVYTEIKTVWEVSYQKDDTAARNAFHRVQQRIRDQDQNPGIFNVFKSLNRRTRYVLATFCAGILITSMIFYLRFQINTASLIRIATLPGQKKEVLLQDGTKVFMAPQSELIYPTAFTDDNRVVQLQGEAYFEVTKNPHRKFIVRTRVLDVQVLGTHFNVNSYTKNTTTVVSLLEGKVRVTTADDNEEYFMSPGNELAINNQNHQAYLRKLNQQESIGWMTNTLLMRNEKLGQVAEKINRIYGVKIIFADQETADTRLYAEFKNETLQTVLETISATGNIEYHIEMNKVYLKLKQ